MELKYILLVLLKILVSTNLVLQQANYVEGTALMGGHKDNRNLSEIDDSLYDEYEYSDSSYEETSNDKLNKTEPKKFDSEEIPNPSPLVLPGYNLPENIFNHGKPFYVEKDPLTGKIDFNHKTPTLKSNEDNLYDYGDDNASTDDIYDKKNIDRKDGSISYSGHKHTDVNQLTPNFHDFLNLPVKYNPEKYVYPLISSSYASTKIQGSVNKFHNHKDTFGVHKTTTTKKPLTYFTTQSYFTPRTTQRTMVTTPVTTTTTTKPTTVKRYPELTTSTPISIIHSSMAHPSFNEEYEYYDETTLRSITSTKRAEEPSTQNIKDAYLTTKGSINTVSTPATTTKRVLSIFEQLFGDYDDTVPTTIATKLTSKSPNLFSNIPIEKTQFSTKPTTKLVSFTTTTNIYPNIHAGPHQNNFEQENSYEYMDEDYSQEKLHDNIAVENKPDHLSVEPLKTTTKPASTNKTSYVNKPKLEKKPANDIIKNKPFNVKPSYYEEYSTTPKSTTISTTTTATRQPSPTTHRPTVTTSRVTSLPLGENHISPTLNKDPIIVATQNLREKLNSEKVRPENPNQVIVELPSQTLRPLAPSSSNILIAPGQDTVSFVVGHHQSVGDGGQFVGTALKESPYDNKPFRPLYSNTEPQQGSSAPNQDSIKQPHPYPEVGGSAISIQTMANSEASLAIGMPVNGIKQVPGQVMDASLDSEGHIQFPKGDGGKIVFPENKKPLFSNMILPRPDQPTTLPNKEVLKLNSKPMYHQLPSDLTPPKENDAIPLRYGPSDRPIRPPWDPRPGHFYSGKPEYVRPPRPPPEIAYKRIDHLPNILPQFRPNTKHHYSMGPPSYPYDQRLNRQPLLERPSNRPIGFFEKVGPPPHQSVYKRYPPLPQKSVRGAISQMPKFEPHRPMYDIEERIPLAKQPPQSLEESQSPMAEDRIMNEPPRAEGLTGNIQELNMYQTPPNIPISNRRNEGGKDEIETLQMIQAKKEKDEDKTETQEEKFQPDNVNKDNSTVKILPQDPDPEESADKSIYKVYPVNTVPIVDVNQNEPVTNLNNFNYHSERNDAPVLKPHPRPGASFAVKSDFPYPLERPDSTTNEVFHNFNNQWNSVGGENLESRIVSTGKKHHVSNQISATLKTYTEKPIAIAYTPTEPHLHPDRYSMPNYGSPVIPEIRPGTVENADTGYGGKGSEFTVQATMHTNPNFNVPQRGSFQEHTLNHRIDMDMDTGPLPAQQDFQAPFQASVKLDAGINQGWSVVRDKNRTAAAEEIESTTLPLATTSEFDIENFRPQLIGGFKPLYSVPDDMGKEGDISDREEKGL
ncbi:uncharacterized protein LOC126743930 [Anthonomus grandis grandis]|uniref:uncharacterized protein LOC126743930 n=1 Tax=Anthonomus grandis grandis TaxID=2921223 RepID=UPI002166B0CD|nr:uncharacterized protein LOC126743930 [Anthonomus grandis grandis]XP_050307178.1 uncharacterized protein LOC126743930 [Anthonomus grandis grandis]XP_050307186.1 uncharacterized protein LOC126743930 [Anthonomus grandis grandis]